MFFEVLCVFHLWEIMLHLSFDKYKKNCALGDLMYICKYLLLSDSLVFYQIVLIHSLR